MLTKISKFLVYLVPFTAVLVYQGTLFPFIVTKYTFFRTVIELAVVFFVWAWAAGEFKTEERGKRKEQRENKSESQTVEKKGIVDKIKSFSYRFPLIANPLTIAVAVFAFIFVIAGIFGFDPHSSFWSNYERGEGGFQMLHLLAFFLLTVLLFKDSKSWKRLFDISLWASLGVIVYGLLAAVNFAGLYGGDLCQRFAGSLGNPAYVGTYMLFSIFYALYRAFEQNTKGKKWGFISLAAFFFITLLYTQTRGALLGLGAGIVALLIYFAIKVSVPKLRKIAIGSVILLIIFGTLGIIYRRDIDLQPFCAQSGGNRILDVSFDTETLQTRLILWQKAIEIWKERPLLGWGPENFYPALERHYDVRLTAWFDRAHNVFFDYLSMTGILGLLSYIGLFAAYYWMFFKKQLAVKREENRSTKELILWSLMFALPIAYLVQGLVLFDVLSIYINLFLILAFGAYKFLILETKHNAK